ncbi:adenylate cyclase type 2b [Micropterus dolomieu]|uniref:adenylate cyclase type 2b n=1 Tax=Micropterus dolomieu TaxID=147949 RepID=UPI001E8DBD08|nr:adenylate cyclase type 2b [Micropterus dolomieu]
MWQEALWTHGRYLLEKNDGGEGAEGPEGLGDGCPGFQGEVCVEGEKPQDWLYESYYRMSQQHPLIVFLLLIVMGTCLALLAVFFASGLNTEDHLTFLITVPAALFLFLSIFILVCIESVFKRMLRLFSLLIWACLVTMGYLFMFSGGILSPWDQDNPCLPPSSCITPLSSSLSRKNINCLPQRGVLWVCPLLLPVLTIPSLSLHPQQGRKGSFCSLTWFPTSSHIIVTNNPWLRLVLTMTTTALILVMAVFNMFFVEDPGGSGEDELTTTPPEVLITTPPVNLTNASLLDYTEENTGENKFYLPYFIYCCILGLVSCSVFLRINYELKMVVMLVAVVIYNIIILQTHASLLDGFSEALYPTVTLERPGVLKDLKTMGSVSLFIFFITLLVLARQNEYYCRLDFLWRDKFKRECEEIETMENLNRVLLENVLPAHVAEHFLGRNWKNEDLYHQSYESVCVMFASIPDFKEFYTESDVNKEGLECLRLLNEIIADFDELLSKPKFSGVEKIKTIGSTYMAATGLNVTPGPECAQEHDRQYMHIGTMVEFAFALVGKLDVINKHSFNDFRLRIGINHGPVIAGVIGAQKPQYDIWGNSVNVASRMETTGVLGKIQVTEETSHILSTLGYMCSCRGIINVKGKGELKTYFVHTEMTRSLSQGTVMP